MLREQAPVHPIADTGVHLVSTRRLIEEVLDRPDDFSAHLTGVLITGDNGHPEIFDMTTFGTPLDALATADEPDHAVHRRLVLPAVTPRAIAAMEPALREWSKEAISLLVANGGGDFVEGVAHPIPMRATTRLLGVPIEDWEQLLTWSLRGGEILAGPTRRERLSEVGQSGAEMGAYLADHLRKALGHDADGPESGLIGAMATGIRAGRIDQQHALGCLVILASAAGESTASLLGNAVRILAESPTLQGQLRASPKRIPVFIEEVARLESSFQGHYRVVKRNTTLGGLDLVASSRLFLLWGAANRDPEFYSDPDRLSLDRPNPHDHLAFGHGSHFCVGARLARLEARVLLEEFLASTVSIELDPERTPSRQPSIQVRRHRELPLKLTSG